MKITVDENIDFAADILKNKDKLLAHAREQKVIKKHERLDKQKRARTERKVIDMVDHYLVQSSDGSHWHTVSKDLSSCKEPSGTLCMAYKFRRDCGHIQSVVTFLKKYVPKLSKSTQELIDFIRVNGWTNHIQILQQGFKESQVDLALSTYEIVKHPKNKALYHILE